MSYQNYRIPVPPIPRACTTYTLVRYFWKMCKFAHFITRVLPDHVHRPLDITLIPEKFDPNEIEEFRKSLVPTPLEMLNEETEVKGVGRTNSGRYPWGAKVNDIPCGEDAIE